ncbi:hypothetical protein BY458DRAFT_504002 [Sporodiniella umbellata]|nr:hypothetical protein BY458DRAFT_504002 [Sporodiniella umbellata]
MLNHYTHSKDSAQDLWFPTTFDHTPLIHPLPDVFVNPYYYSQAWAKQDTLDFFHPDPIMDEPWNVSSTSSACSSPQWSRSPSPCKETKRRKLVVPEEKTFACDVKGCGKVFGRQEHVKRHIRSIHTKEKPFACPYTRCQKRFARSDNLNQHIRTHRKTN